MFRLVRKPEEKPEDQFAAAREKLRRHMDQVLARRRQLIEAAMRGCIAGGFCVEHHLEIVTLQACGCEGLRVRPFEVAFWTSLTPNLDQLQIVLNYGWHDKCFHGTPLPLSAPLSHDITPKGAHN